MKDIFQLNSVIHKLQCIFKVIRTSLRQYQIFKTSQTSGSDLLFILSPTEVDMGARNLHTFIVIHSPRVNPPKETYVIHSYT